MAYYAFLSPRPLHGYADRDLDQLADAQARQIADAHAEAGRRHLSLGTAGEVVGGADLKDAARLQRTVGEATALGDQIRREQLVRRWRFPAVGVVALAFALGLAARVARRREPGAASLPHAGTSGGIQYRSADPEESWARHTLGVSAFATADDVESAFRLQMAQYHPDKVAHLGPDLQQLAEKKSRELVKARDVLRRILQGVPDGPSGPGPGGRRT